MTITFGWWLLPLGITIAAFSWRAWVHRNDTEPTGYGRIGAGLGAALTMLVALAASLIAWLIWALLK